MPQGHNSVITCRIDLKLGGNVAPDFAKKMHFNSLPYTIAHQGFISKINVPCRKPKYAPFALGAQSKC